MLIGNTNHEHLIPPPGYERFRNRGRIRENDPVTIHIRHAHLTSRFPTRVNRQPVPPPARPCVCDSFYNAVRTPWRLAVKPIADCAAHTTTCVPPFTHSDFHAFSLCRLAIPTLYNKPMTAPDSSTFHEPLWSITEVVLTQADKFPDKTAIEFIGGECWTFADCKAQALLAAARLKQAGITSENNVALMIDSPAHFCHLWLGLNFLGATMVAINTGMRGSPLEHQLDISNSQILIAGQQHLEMCQRITSDATVLAADDLLNRKIRPISGNDVFTACSSGSDLSCIMFTSGTSGPSKGVLMPQAHCMLFAVGTIDNYQLTPNDVFYICLPLFHANGLFMQLLACLTIGCKAVVREKFSASNWLNDIRQYQITHTNTLGAVAAFIVAQKPSPDDKNHSLRVLGAAPLPAVAEESFRNRFGIESVIPLYGMTEVNIPLYGKLKESAPGTCGRLYDKYFEVEIRDAETDDPVEDR